MGRLPEPDQSADDFFWDAAAPRELWLRRLGRANWVLIFTIVGTIGTVTGAIIAYLAWMSRTSRIRPFPRGRSGYSRTPVTLCHSWLVLAGPGQGEGGRSGEDRVRRSPDGQRGLSGVRHGWDYLDLR